MHKFAERLFDKHLTKIIGEITVQVCKENFDKVFKDFCESACLNNNTIGATYNELQEMAIKEVNKIFDKRIDEVSHEVWKIGHYNKDNIFAELLNIVWGEFIDYTWVSEIVENFIGDERYEKQNDLYEKGILDFEGDYIGVSE